MLTETQMLTAIACAVRAPSLHNTQPWLFTRVPEGILVRADTTRWLRAEDPLGRELLLSCGGAVRHLVLGLRLQGLDVRCDLLPHPETDPDLVAAITIVGRRPVTPDDTEFDTASQLRHTDRSRFSEKTLPAEVLDRLRAVAELGGCFLDVLDDDDTLELAVLTARADHVARAEPALRGEQSRWTAHGSRPAEGVPATALPAHGAGRASPVRLRDFGADDSLRIVLDDDPEPPAAEHPVLVVLGTPTDDRLSWVQCGWTLTEVLLSLTMEGLVASPLTQALEIPGVRSCLRTALGLQGRPQMVLRLGYPAGDGSARTGRRTVGEVLC